MLPPGPRLQRRLGEGARRDGKTAKLPRAYWDWQPMLQANEKGFFPYTPATNLLYGLREALRDAGGGGARQRLRPPRPPRRGDAPRRPRLGARDPVRRPARVFELADRRPDARRDTTPTRCARSSSTRFDMSLGHGPRQARRQGLPHRPSRRLQRSHAEPARCAASRWASASPACRISAAASTRRWTISPAIVRRRLPTIKFPKETPLPLAGEGRVRPSSSFLGAAECVTTVALTPTLSRTRGGSKKLGRDKHDGRSRGSRRNAASRGAEIGQGHRLSRGLPAAKHGRRLRDPERRRAAARPDPGLEDRRAESRGRVRPTPRSSP